MDTTALALGVSICAFLVVITALSIYTAFGPPAKNLADPYDEHED
ncbi:photosystem II protein N [Geitlerinema sp. PCC 7407]|nr:photosystem II protein N [Geitlerinema sp. PCC 7407]AFY67084.1 photosystem II protein PsbN [Geitlerinema sp. PCC 7407]